MADLSALPADLLGRCLGFLPLAQLAPAIAALRLTCSFFIEQAGGLGRESHTWSMLQRRVELSVASASSPSRRSVRLVASQEDVFIKAWGAMLQRAEALHHAVACAGQDSKDLNVGKLKQLTARFGMPLVDRASPVYNATLLMEVCRARGVRESKLLQAADFLIHTLRADPSARPSEASCSPLIIAASRGMYRLSAFLLACGADPRPRGEGRFRLSGLRSTIAGTHTAREFVKLLYLAEVAQGVDSLESEALLVTYRLLELHADQAPHANDPKAVACRAVHDAALKTATRDVRRELLADSAESGGG